MENELRFGGTMLKTRYSDKRYSFYKKIYASAGRVNILTACDFLIVATFIFTFSVCMYRAFLVSVLYGVLYMMSAGLPFIMVTSLRIMVTAQRPYEIYDFSILTSRPPHYKKGRSFPSRHVFSAFLIGVLATKIVLPLGIVTLSLGLVLAVIRVLLGVHFIRDVVGGALIGSACGMIGMMIL